MKILFDHYLFYQEYGGASKYFVMMIKHLPKGSWDTTALWSCNEYARANKLIPTIRKRFFKQDTLFEHLNRPYTKLVISRGHYDILHQTDFDNYFYHELGTKPLVVTYHDSNLSTLDSHPEIVKRQAKALQRANAIIAVSKNTKKDLLQLFDIDERKVHVIYHGIEIPDLESVPAQRIIKESYFLYVGRRSAYKNFARLAQAFALFHKTHANVRLVCTSQFFSNEEMSLFHKLGIEESVTSIKADEDDMKRLYRDAVALVFPSYYEGFGMPILEAWSCHCPVLLSNASCFPEIAGEAGVYFNPDSAEEMSQSMTNIYEKPSLRQKMIALGNERIKNFSWERCSEEHIKVYKTLL